MYCTLMHKNIPVVDMEMLPDTGHIIRLFNLQTPEHLPVGTGTKDGVNRKRQAYENQGVVAKRSCDPLTTCRPQTTLEL